MSFTYWISEHERQNTKQSTRGMSTCRPCHLQLPLRPRTLLITDVTRLQPFTVGGDSFRENLETLVSYNVRTDEIQQDCLYIEQGHLMTPTTFMTYSMAIDPRQSVVVTWIPIKMYSTPQGSRPSSRPGSPLFTSSSRPTSLQYMPYPTKPKGGWQRQRQVVVNKSMAQLRETKATRKFMNKYHEVFQTSMVQGSNNPPGPFLYQEDGKNVCLAARRNAEEYSVEPSVRENAKRLSSRRNRSTENDDGQRPGCAYGDSTGVFAEGSGWPNAANEQSPNDGRISSQERSDQNTPDGIPGHREPEKQVSDMC